ILLIDNYDSFVYNLARYVRELGEEPVVRRNDSVSLDDIAALRPSHIVISPGPGGPGEAGISTEAVRRFGAATPILGVCLGLQFRPESVLSEHGYRLLDRFLHGAAAWGEVLPPGADAAASFPNAETREHPIEDVVGRDDTDKIVQRADGGAEVRRGGDRFDA